MLNINIFIIFLQEINSIKIKNIIIQLIEQLWIMGFFVNIDKEYIKKDLAKTKYDYIK